MTLEEIAARVATTRHRPQALRTGETRGTLEVRNADGADGPAEVLLYDEIGFWGTTARSFLRQLDSITADEIVLRVNSPGGDVFDGVAIYNALRRRGGTCNAVVDGLAASAASFIVQAADTITMAPASQMMIHDAWGIAIGSAAEVRTMADLLEQTSALIADVYAARAGRPADELRQAMLATTWYTASEAVDAGLADVAEQIAAPAAAALASWDLRMFHPAPPRTPPAPAPAPTNQLSRAQLAAIALAL